MGWKNTHKMKMEYFSRRFICFFLAVTCIWIASCQKQTVEGQVRITNQEFSLRQDSEYAYVVDGRGIVKNVGAVDVKNIVVTGNCKSCGDALVAGEWMVSPDIEKTANQKDVINYLAPGAERQFAFRGVAYMYNKVPEKPDLPEGLEAVILSFETMAKD